MMQHRLTRKQIADLHDLMKEYPDATEVRFTYSSTTGIGTNVYATVRCAECCEYTVEITDYESW